jgi:hypothetical protein
MARKGISIFVDKYMSMVWTGDCSMPFRSNVSARLLSFSSPDQITQQLLQILSTFIERRAGKLFASSDLDIWFASLRMMALLKMTGQFQSQGGLDLFSSRVLPTNSCLR